LLKQKVIYFLLSNPLGEIQNIITNVEKLLVMLMFVILESNSIRFPQAELYLHISSPVLCVGKHGDFCFTKSKGILIENNNWRTVLPK